MNISINTLSREEIIQNKNHYIEFLHTHLDRFRDSMESINECFDYLLEPAKGGHLFIAENKEELLGLVVILNTQMKKFVPENFLVYIAVSEKMRGKGVGGMLIEYAQDNLEGSICLHVEHDNPARKLYERKNFTSKYLEMRYSPES